MTPSCSYRIHFAGILYAALGFVALAFSPSAVQAQVASLAFLADLGVPVQLAPKSAVTYGITMASGSKPVFVLRGFGNITTQLLAWSGIVALSIGGAYADLDAENSDTAEKSFDRPIATFHGSAVGCVFALGNTVTLTGCALTTSANAGAGVPPTSGTTGFSSQIPLAPFLHPLSRWSQAPAPYSLVEDYSSLRDAPAKP